MGRRLENQMGVLNSAKRRQNDHFFGKIASFGEVFGNLQILVRHMRATINKWGVFGIFTLFVTTVRTKASKSSFLQKRNEFWAVPSRSVRLFFSVPSQKERRSFSWNRSKRNPAGIWRNPAGMCNLDRGLVVILCGAICNIWVFFWYVSTVS